MAECSSEHRVVVLARPVVTVEEVLTGIGMPPTPDSTSPAILAVVQEALDDAGENLLKPKALLAQLVIREADAAAGVAKVDGYRGLVELRVPAWSLDGAEGFMAVLTTLGPDLEAAMQRKLEEGDTLYAMALDAIGSYAVMEASTAASAIALASLEDEGQAAGAALEPGVGNASIQLQQDMFDAVDASVIGLAMMDSSLMVPKKSVSSLIPYGKAVVARGRGCGSCMRKAHGGCPAGCPHKDDERMPDEG